MRELEVTTPSTLWNCRKKRLTSAYALLLVTPYYNKTTQKGLVEHYGFIAERVALPMIVYNVPSRTGLNILPETYAELKEIPNIVAIKEANGNVSALCKTFGLCRDSLDVYSGDDALITPCLSLGAKGVISVLANICPAQVHEICTSFFEGDHTTAAMIQTDYHDLIEALFCEVNPVPVKVAQSLLGLCSDAVLLPARKDERKRKGTACFASVALSFAMTGGCSDMPRHDKLSCRYEEKLPNSSLHLAEAGIETHALCGRSEKRTD